ncbi:VWA domain-containing protein [Pontibacter qinzhouensis]|uniref:VWA domain-containing protein n=1 Tax=Pontibacter qinzhouensis TaxID=2603253 RepID=A0A5C8K3K3_9BACT|nr:vWA domain-containing protein [Pontibacter qinzhouensis]TXK44449.1 VWA domain-containing protein [Pontibacter qinzhouensis]
MSSFRILTTYSPWLILACLAAGALYAWLLYSKRTPWSKNLNLALSFLRFAVVSFLCFLLLGPLVRYLSNTTLQPTIVFAVDNSSSVTLFSDTSQLRQTQQGLQQLMSKLQDNGYNTEIRTLEAAGPEVQNLTDIRFKQEATNLHQLLQQAQTDQERQNLAGVVLLSDGIVNQGTSPTYANYNFTIYPVAIGDTVPKKDVILTSLRYNKVNYSGNKFPIEAEIQHEGFGGSGANVLLKENGKVLERKQVILQANRPLQVVPFSVLAGGLGKRHYEIEVQPLQGEFTTLNNSKHAYIDMVKGKIKILVAAAAPHPDIKAIRAAIESNENYETELFVPGVNTLKQQDYDVAVLHQLPGKTPGGEAVLQLVRQKQMPALFIIGPQSDISAFNRLNMGLSIGGSGDTDEVTSALNPNFSTFKFASEATERLLQYPPATVPYAEFELSKNAETVLYQQVGRVRTNRPLLVVQNANDRRNATLLASGTWQWRLSEASAHEKPEVYDKLITNLVQLLTAPRNKKRLNVYPARDEYSSADEIYFEAEAYNQALEPIYGQTISLKITAEDGTTKNFSFANGENQAGVNIGSLSGGRYSYSASATIGGQLQQDKGEFVVEELQLEALNAVADHNLLFQLGNNTGSRLYYPAQLQQLEEDILKADHQNLIYSSESLNDIVGMKWLFFVILALICVEWFVRKYNGSY